MTLLMPWLAALDARASRRSSPVRALYLSARYGLIALGAWCACYQAIVELGERRVGIGTGIATALLLAGIKGVLLAITGHTPGQTPAP